MTLGKQTSLIQISTEFVGHFHPPSFFQNGSYLKTSKSNKNSTCNYEPILMTLDVRTDLNGSFFEISNLKDTHTYQPI